ncbi:MAG: MerR family DNA-binding protein, partial [Pseudomonadota bacterium]
GFSLEEIRQLLNLYDIGDQQLTQLQQTYALAVERRGIMEAQRDELTAALGDLDDQLAYVADILADRGVTAAPIAKKTASAR